MGPERAEEWRVVYLQRGIVECSCLLVVKLYCGSAFHSVVANIP